MTNRMANDGKAENTIRAYRADVQQYMIFCMFVHDNKGETTDVWSSQTMRAFINHYRAGMTPATSRRRMASLRTLAQEAGLPNPFEGYRGPIVAKGRAHPLPDMNDDIVKILAQCETNEQRALIALMGYVGCRVGETLLVRGLDFHSTGDGIIVTIRGKGDKERVVPVSAMAWAIIQPRVDELQGDWLPLILYSHSGARGFVTRKGARAGVRRAIASHDLRMTFGTAVYGACRDIRVTQELLGHAQVMTTETYTMVREDAMASAVEGAFK